MHTLTMNSKAIGADMVYAWPERFYRHDGCQDPQQRSSTQMSSQRQRSSAALINEKAAEYAELQSSALSAAKRGYVDDIIDAKDTRKRVIAAFDMLFTKREDRPAKKHGTV